MAEVLEKQSQEGKASLATVAVIGLGYVGLPVAVAFGRQRRTIEPCTSSAKPLPTSTTNSPAHAPFTDTSTVGMPLNSRIGIGSTPGPVVCTLPTGYPESTTFVGSEPAPNGGVRFTHSSCGPVYRYPTRSILLDTCQSVVRNVWIPASAYT